MIKNLVKLLYKFFNKTIVIKRTSLQRGGTKIRIPEIAKIKKLGFKPKFNLLKGLNQTINYK